MRAQLLWWRPVRYTCPWPPGSYIANQMFTKETGEKTLADGEADAVADGRLFIVVARW
jgi:hypothetical protein